MGPRRARQALCACMQLLAMFLVLGACAGQQPRRNAAAPESGASAPTTPKHLVVAIAGQPVGVSQAVTRAVLAYSVPGGEFLEALASRGLAVYDESGLLHPSLGETVPSIDNGLWVLNVDGTMDTTWTIRRGAAWHDGTPVTVDDLLFTLQVRQEGVVPVLRDRTLDLVSSAEQTDARTIVLHWEQPFYAADAVFSTGLLPKHLLESSYGGSDAASFVNLPYWAADYVGAGPYRLSDWQDGSHAVFDAFDGYVLGRPRIDQVEVRFIPDSSTILANVLAGTVQLAVGRDFSVDQATRIAPQWSDGRPELAPGGWVVIFPQFINPSPAIVADVRFRRALLYALDRQQMVDTIQAGKVQVAQAFFGPQDPEFGDANQAAVRYDYDPAKATQLLQDLGYTRDADGRLVDAARQTLSVPIWSSGGLDMQTKSMLSTADYWKQIGIDADPVVVPTQRWNDREYVSNFPAFRLNQQSVGRGFMMNMLSSGAPLPENHYVGANYARYRNPELDALINQFVVTVRPEDRTPIIQQMVQITTGQVAQIGLFYNATAVLIANRVHGVKAGKPGWDVQLWDMS